MAVDDHGLETLKKAAEEVTPGDKSNLYYKVGLISVDYGYGNISPETLRVGIARDQSDAFGRIRVGIPHSILDAYFVNDLVPELFSTQVVGSGTVTHNSTLGSANISTTGSSGDVARFQSRSPVRYNSGKSQQFYTALSMGSFQSNNIKRFGLFDGNNGIFFEVSNSTVKVGFRSNTSGSPVDTTINQSSWNIDKLDGTGVSGLNINFTVHQLFGFDFTWLGAGQIRFGVFANGRLNYCHEINFTNSIVSGAYMKSATLPVRYENINTGASSASSIILTCANVNSEAGFEPRGLEKSVNTESTAVLATATLTPIISLRLNTSFPNSLLKANRAQVFCTTDDDMRFEVYRNASLTGASFVSNGKGEFDVTATSFTGGTRVTSGYFRSVGGAPSNIDVSYGKNEYIGIKSDGTSDILTIVAARIGGTGSARVFGSIDYEEL